MSKKFFQHLLSCLLLFVGLFAATVVLAQGFGVGEVNNGLAGSLSAADPRMVAGRIINIVLGFLGVIAVGLIAYAGFLWFSSGGNEEKVETAKKILRNAIIGLVIILASWGIATFILTKLGGTGSGSSGNGCYEGEIAACGCGGSMLCSGGSFGACVGSDCGDNNGGGPTSCDASQNAGCQATDQICAAGKYCDHNDCGCKPKGKLGDPCNADTAGGTCSPDNNRCAEYLTCNPQTCLCYGPPVITEISPVGGFCQEDSNKSCVQDSDCTTGCDLSTPNGTANNFLTITGKNFETYSATGSQVVFAANTIPALGNQPASLNPACINTWNDEQIVIAVPGGVSSGPIKVVNQDGLSDTTNDDYGPAIADFQANSISRPGLCYLDPNSGVMASQVAYQGVNLYSSQAYFGNYKNNVKALDSQFNEADGLAGTSTTPNIKPGESGSFVQNTLNGRPEKSNYLRFTKETEPAAGPYISSFYPTAGNTGQYVTIRGNAFGGARGSARVYFGNTEAAYDFPDMCLNSVWKNNQVVVKVPPGLSDGDQVIRMLIGTTTIDTQQLNPNAFRFDKNLDLRSSLCKIEPDRGPAGTPVTLWGEYFGTLNSEGLVKFNYDKNATGTIQKDGRANMIKTAVPTGAITGPVRVINKSVWGNELNFAIGECTADADCGTQVCCPANTYKSGRCANALADCFIDIPNSVFEWSFNTTFSTSSDPTTGSCAGLASYFGACQTGTSCPNVPGSCSPYAGGGKKVVGDCDFSCAGFNGCGLLGAACHYEATIDKCVQNEAGGGCDVDQTISYVMDGQTRQTAATCNSDRHWEIALSSSCPDGWSKGSNNKCIDLNSTCAICSSDLQCVKLQATDSTGHCVSPELCAGSATCARSFQAGQDKCVVPDQPTCDCCCTIGQDARDCCAPLKCEGSCGVDTGKTSNVTLGRCGGCKAAGDTAVERDAACNCAGHSGQFCDINNPQFPNGVCTDCAGLSGQDCSDHSGVCCLDARKTATTTDDVCRGGNGQGITTDPANPDFGYCAYYKCQDAYATPPGDPTKCASSTPLKIGNYPSLAACDGDCPKADPCTGITDLAECQKHSNCCFDAKNDAAAKCRLGNPITGGDSQGYCAYYECAVGPTGAPVCASSTPVATGIYNSLESCTNYCVNPPSGPGLSCAGKATSTCASEKCNFPNFACFGPDGQLGVAAPDCGTCCCQPGSTTTSPFDPNIVWKCLADKGACTGASRGLYCGCTSDEQCGPDTLATIGCGSDTCCQSRPRISTTSPAHLAEKVCRNALLKIDFDSLMDISSFSSNVLLLEERNYGSGVCPSGTFVARGDSLSDILAQKNKSWLARLADQFRSTFRYLARRLSGQVLADVLPSASKLYCAVPGTVSGENAGDHTVLAFAPQKLLAPAVNYYLVVKGDENLNSKSGVLSAAEIGFNGQGYGNNAALSSYTPAKDLKFNNHSYPNSQIIKFTTLSDQSPSAGICTIDKVAVLPASYLFKTTDNDLNENDSNPAQANFDTAADRDKVFMAQAYSTDGQFLQPVTGYFWDWRLAVDNPDIAAITPIAGLPADQALVTVRGGVVDGETKLTATIDMTRFVSTACNSGNCSCQDAACSNNCCNAYSGGNGFNADSDLYVFLCNNPWPPVGADGGWQPWVDNSANCLPTSGNCSSYNYKFYYCRDAGTNGTLDDLPAIIDQAVVRGTSNNLICSSDRNPCPVLNGACGPDQNGDGAPDGLCLWNVLKESYFFRAGLPAGGAFTNAVDQRTGGAVKVEWTSDSSQAAAYKIYYLKSGKGSMLSQEFKVAQACTTSGALNNCQAVISGLTNDTPYVFKATVISANRTETQLTGEKTVTPTDGTPPVAPTGLNAAIIGDQLKFSWLNNTDDANFYRLYHGVSAGQYGESFDAAVSSVNLLYPLDQLVVGAHYFALSALDSHKNESGKSAEFSLQRDTAETITVNSRQYQLLFNNWWYQAASLAELPNGMACLVKLNVGPNAAALCNDDAIISTSSQWFAGTIKDAGAYPYCATAGCLKRVDPNKCRYLDGNWANQCYIHD
ncbi:MAG: IPT/TIG domain-containing protein [Patescibacteria group bacterium]